MPAGFGNHDAVAIAREYFKRLDAGDDAILVIARSERARRGVQARVRGLAGLPA